MRTAEGTFEAVKTWLETKVEPDYRWLRIVQLRFSQFISHDQLMGLVEFFGQTDLSSEASQKVYADNVPWFAQFVAVTNLDELAAATQPLTWDYDRIYDGLGDGWQEELFETLDSVFLTKLEPDYSTAVPFTALVLEHRPMVDRFYIDWLEEFGFVKLGDSGVMLSRTIAPLIVANRGEGAPSELVMLLLPTMGNDQIAESLPIIPSASGGIAFKGVFEPRQLNINAADQMFIEEVTTALVLVGTLVPAATEGAPDIFEPLPDEMLDHYAQVVVEVDFNQGPKKGTKPVPLLNP